MKRWLFSFFALVLFLGLALLGFCGWLLRSNDGAAWLLEAVSDAFEVQITTGLLDGQLVDELLVNDLVIVWPDGQLTASRVHLVWEPFRLLQKNLKISSLEVGQLEITTGPGADVPQDPADVTPFTASDLALLPDWLTVQIDRLEVLGVTLQGEDGATAIADEISGQYLWSQWQFKAESFTYLTPSVHLRGSLDWDLQSPHLEMLADVHLPITLVDPQQLKDIAVPQDFPAQLSLDGDWNDFSGSVRFGDAGERVDSVWLTAEASGSWQGIRFGNLQARYLNGSLAGDLDLAWIDAFRVVADLSASGLDPAVLNKDLAGRASLEVSGALLIPYDDLPLQANVSALIKEGQLRGHAISGSLAADWQDGDLHTVKLDLSGDGARVVAQGKPAERVDLDLAVADLSSFYNGLAGQLAASGWLRWSDDYLTGEVQGSGKNVAWQEMKFASLKFKGRHVAQAEPLGLELDGQGFQYGESQLDHLQLGVSGTLEQHDVHAEIEGPIGNLDFQLAGQYREEAWQGQLLALAGKTPELGSWNLVETARLAWHSGEGSLEGLSVVSQRGERLNLEHLDLDSSKRAQLSLNWHDVSHDWLAYLRPSQIPSGQSSGELSIEIIDSQPVALRASVTAGAELQNDISVVTVPIMTAEAVWLKDGLTLDISAESDGGEKLELSAHSSQPPGVQWPPEQLSLAMHWQGLSLARISRFRQDIEAQGQSDGSAQLEILDRQLLSLNAKVSAAGLIQQKTQPVGFKSLQVELSWDDNRFHSSAYIEGAYEGILDLQLTSAEAPDFAWPDSGQVELDINGLNLKSLNPFLPPELKLNGAILGKSKGYWQNGGQIFLDGQVKFEDSGLLLLSREGQVDIQAPRADIEWQWQGEHLIGSLNIQLAKDGELHGSWQLPLPAHWPLDFDTRGTLQASLQGQFQATGILAALAPGLVQDLHGRIKSDLQVNGTWQEPIFSGELALLEAGAYLPANGVTLEDLDVRARLQDSQIKIDNFSLRSGPGTLSGTGSIDLDPKRLGQYQFEFHGERLQAYNFPEIQVLCNPDLTLSGDADGLHLDGSVLIPEMNLFGTSTAPEVLPSPDVVISGEEVGRRTTLPFATDIRVAVELGDQVRVKTAGLETRLEGGGMVTLNNQDQLAIWGEISLAEGGYKAYGANLAIKQGVLKYNGGPPANPGLSILAVREVGTILAGVQVTGTAEAPVVTLYSQPTMPERDILGYIFMGRPMRADQEGQDALRIGAGALMPGDGGTFSNLGISEIDIQGLFSGTGGVTLRKRLAESWEIESTLGIESGVDLYYIFKFD